jgi:ribA/ribD-fused uncharacterized protein
MKKKVYDTSLTDSIR